MYAVSTVPGWVGGVLVSTGDADDMLSRLRDALPRGWFPLHAPVLDVVLTSGAWSSAWLYMLIDHARAQMRLGTATGNNLEMIAFDFFGDTLPRRESETDDAYRARVTRELFRPRATRPAMVAILTELTGVAPRILEPQRPADTLVYGRTAYGRGRYGSYRLPYQCFIEVTRPVSNGVARIRGYRRGAYGHTPYSSRAEAFTYISDDDIYAAIARTKAEGTICWTRIS